MTNKQASKLPEAEPVGSMVEATNEKAPAGDISGIKTYEVTKVAGPRVAGRRTAPGKTIELSDAEAMTELLNGSIVLKESV